MDKLKIEYKGINDLIPYINNPRINDNAVDKVASSIKNFGFKNPIIIDKDNEIIAGHTRLKAARKLGLEEVPTIKVEDLTEPQIKAFRIADNKTSEFAEWDFGLLEIELEGLDDEFTGFDMKELDDMFPDDTEVIEDDFDVEENIPEEPNAKYGEIYKLGRHRLMCGDSTKKDDVSRLMNGDKADMVFTDPPYNVAFNGRSGKFEVIKNDNLNEYDFKTFINAFIKTIKTLNVETYYIWCNWKFYGILQEGLPFKSCIVWAKNNFGLGTGYRHQHEFCLFNGNIDDAIKNESDLWQVSKDTKYMHPTQKPIELADRALKNHRNKIRVVDFFGGSGSTLIACEQLNKNCYMMELDPIYVDVIIKRWEEFTGEKAVLLNG